MVLKEQRKQSRCGAMQRISGAPLKQGTPFWLNGQLKMICMGFPLNQPKGTGKISLFFLVTVFVRFERETKRKTVGAIFVEGSDSYVDAKRARLTRLLVFKSICQGCILGTMF